MKIYRTILISLMTIQLGIIIFIHPSFILGYACITILLTILLLTMNEVFYEYSSMREAYESLINEFRMQKRQAFKNEHTARLEERTMIAREMHDSVGHKLTALLMQIELLAIGEKHPSLDLLREMAKESLEETRKAVRLLQEEELQGISAVIHLIRKLESENAVYVHLTTKQGVLNFSINNLQGAILYRIMQEGLTNAMKYGSSKQVFIILGRSPIGHLFFEIKNKYTHKHPLHEGFGLINMKKRIEEVGGTLHIYQMENHFILQGTMPIEEINR